MGVTNSAGFWHGPLILRSPRLGAKPAKTQLRFSSNSAYEPARHRRRSASQPLDLSRHKLSSAGTAALAYEFGTRFARRDGGGIVLLSSLVAFQGVPRAANYAATKAYVQTFAEGLRQELSGSGVDVLAVAPGPVHSGFGQRANVQMSMAQTPAEVARGALRALGTRVTVRPGFLAQFLELSLKPLPRWGRIRVMGLVMGGMTKHQHPAAQS